MSFGIHEGLTVQAVVLSNEFIDTYMPAANGEYVKVFLYVLRCQNQRIEPTVADIADALNHTEADVRRALAYWERVGVLRQTEQGETAGREPASQTAATAAVLPDSPMSLEAAEAPGLAPLPPKEQDPARLKRLSEDEEFTALLYAVQQYLKKTFSPLECEKFAYFYDELHMTGDLLEYLAEYCAGGGHTSIRYIEKVALNWYQLGIRTREDAKEYSLRFSKDVSSVMKAFGITGRGPAAAEQEYMKKWFREYGFDHKIVSEACGRTIKATGAASFPYADKILTGWKESGVRVLGDVLELDKKRQAQKAQEEERRTAASATGKGDQRSSGQRAGGPRTGSQSRGRSAAPNRFKNFEERVNNYEDMIYENIRKRQRKEEAGHGAQ